MSRGLHKVVANKVGKTQQLSKRQHQVLDMLTKEFETPQRIAVRLQISHQAVYKLINKIRKKGYISRGYSRGLQKIQTTTQLNPSKNLKNGIRLHDQEFNIKILYGSRQYKSALKNKNLFYLDDNTIRLYNQSIEVYSNPHRSFLAEDEQRATALSIQYWNKIFARLEAKLNIILIKGETTDIKQVNGHFSEINNELAEDCNKKQAKLRIYSREDGKLWFSIDNSWDLNEAETLHPGTAKQDMRNVKRFFNDIRDNNPPTLSEVMITIKQTIDINKETAAGLNAVTRLLGLGKGNVNDKQQTIEKDPSYIG